MTSPSAEAIPETPPAAAREAVSEPASGSETGSAEQGGDGPLNEVRLRGTLSCAVQLRELPSGDVLGSWRVVVARPPAVAPVDPPEEADTARGRRAAGHDTIDCVSFDAEVLDLVARYQPGAELSLRGALRRRFFRAGGTLQSRYDVEVRALGC